ncbi:MAG TPA: amidohydrolase family protein [Vicinamibacterales bacterium]|nr:amidohydrolase family protein [Vicinamibacterales bacterium]
MSRRDAIKAATAIAVAPLLLRDTAAAQRAPAAEDAGTLERIWRGAPASRQPILLKGGTVVSMDPKVGDFVKGDVLIDGRKIAAVGDQVKAPAQAQVIDAANTIVIPGFVDAHRHSWEGQLRRIIPDGAIAEYMATTHNGFARHYRPHDIYVGNLITALGCIDAGITCIIDNSHNSRSAAHSDAAVQALLDSGIRGVHASGAPQVGEWDRQWPRDLERLQKTFFMSADQLVTLRLFSGMSRENYAFARRLGIRITTESNAAGPEFDQFLSEGLVRSDITFNHCQGWPDQVWQRVKDAGATVNVCPRSDAQYGLGEGVFAFQKALDHGMRPGFSIDNEVSYGTDMFSEMRVAFNVQRAMATYRKVNGDAKAPTPVSVRTVLECATAGGAACAGLLDRCGTLTPGKEADVVMIRTDDINLYPSNHAIGTVVLAADTRNVDTVIIGGRIRKLRGRMPGVNMEKFREMADESRNYLFGKAGYKLDVLSNTPR